MRNSITILGRALRIAVLLIAGIQLAACAVVKINHDGTDTVEHGGGEQSGKELANLACHKAGAVRAEVISTIPKDADEPADKVRYITTFRCLY